MEGEALGFEGKKAKERYQLGLGKLESDSQFHKKRHSSQAAQEKLFLVEAEKDRERRASLDKSKKTGTFNERVIKDNRRTAKTVRELYAMCESSTNADSNALSLPEITSCKQSTASLKPTLGLILKNSQSTSISYKGTQSVNYGQQISNKLLTESKDPARSFIEKSRGILLAKLMMENKKKEARRMREYVERKESLLKLNKELYEQDKKTIDDYIDYAKKDSIVQKKRADEKIIRRQQKEAELLNLKKKQIILKKDIDEAREEYRTLMEHKEFMLQLDPDLKEYLEQKQRKKLFMTQHEAENSVDKELGSDLDLSQNDSDTEISVRFASSDEVLDILTRIEADNVAMINDSQKREHELSDLRQRVAAQILSKQDRLSKIKEDIEHSKVEVQRRKAWLVELTENVHLLSEEEEKDANAGRVEEIRKDIENLIQSIHSEYAASRKFKGDTKRKTTVQQLEDITSLLIRLKGIRNYKVNKALRLGKRGTVDLFKREDDEKKRTLENAAAEKHRQILEETERKKLDAKKWENITRTKKTMKEMMRSIKFNIAGKTTVVQQAEEIDDLFNDKYFVDDYY